MMETLQDKKKKIEIMQLELNIIRLEARLLELDEEKVKTADSIEQQRLKLQELKQN